MLLCLNERKNKGSEENCYMTDGSGGERKNKILEEKIKMI